MLVLETVLCSDTYNFALAQVPVRTAFKIDNWTKYLHGYDDSVIVKYLCYGWPINIIISQMCCHRLH